MTNGGKKSTRQRFIAPRRVETDKGDQIPINMVIIVRLFEEFKAILKYLQAEANPSESVRAEFRKLKPDSCPICEGRTLQGNGWRSRSVLTSWANWGVVWYWRIRCVTCHAVIMVVPDIVIPDLLYKSDVVVEVVWGWLNGVPAKEYEPHPRTQKRWLNRIKHGWSTVQSAGAIQGELSQWVTSTSVLIDAIRQCMAQHVGLFFPSRAERLKTQATTRRVYPAIATHQVCLSTRVLRL